MIVLHRHAKHGWTDHKASEPIRLSIVLFGLLSANTIGFLIKKNYNNYKINLRHVPHKFLSSEQLYIIQGDITNL